MSLKQQGKKKQGEALDSNEDSHSLQCSENLSDLNLNNQQSKWGVEDSSSLRCDSKEMKENAAERRREKRRKNKQKNKLKLKEVKQKAMIVFQNIIKEIYSLTANYQKVQQLLEECFRLEQNNQILYNQIDQIMRHEIDLIRKKIINELLRFAQHPEETAKDRSIRIIFDCVYRIQKGSPEIEKIINLYVKSRFGEEEDEFPLKTNLDLMTLKFLYKNDLQPSESFTDIVARITRNEAFRREREIYESMIVAATRLESSSHSSEWSGYESEEEQEETFDTNEPKSKEASRKKKKRERRRKAKVEVQTCFESVMQRVSQLQLLEEERVECKVEQSWIQRMKEKKDDYTRTRTNRK